MDRLSSPSVTKAVILKAVQVHGIKEEDRRKSHWSDFKKENLEESFFSAGKPSSRLIGNDVSACLQLNRL